MRRKSVAICLLVASVLCGAGTSALAQEDIKEHRSCSYCGMDRKAYGYSRMLIVYEDGASVGVCSLHCAVTELDANKGRKVKSLLVADRDTRSLIDAETAVWVMGGRKRGVMTQQPKWAFGTKAAAQAFIDANGGTIVTWAEALSAAREDAAAKPR
jgi:nitrous oxide reductase accessory protein NosL